MERQAGCLRDDSIVRFFSGRIDTRERAYLEQHVDVCPDCALLMLPSGSHSAHRERSVCALSSGDLVAGRYRIEQLLGRGGMGEVYAALDEQLGEHVALKTMRSTSGDDARAIARLKSEVQLARRVTHPNVCRIYDLGVDVAPAGRDGDLAFLTMELLPGKTLAEEIRARGAFAHEIALAIMRQLVAGLAAAHRAGVIHKDFKSDNVMLVGADRTPGTTSSASSLRARAVITDFGLASPQTLTLLSARGRGEVSGTPGYVAPERILGAPATPASDVYSLGVVLLDMLKGRVPARPAKRAQKSSVLDLRGLALRCCAEKPEVRPTADEITALLMTLDRRGPRRYVRAASVGVGLLAAGFAFVVWSKSAPVGEDSSARPLPISPRVVTALPMSTPVGAPSPPTIVPAASPSAAKRPVTHRRRSESQTLIAPRETRAQTDKVETPASSNIVRDDSPAPEPADGPIRTFDVPPRVVRTSPAKIQDDAPIDPFSTCDKQVLASSTCRR